MPAAPAPSLCLPTSKLVGSALTSAEARALGRAREVGTPTLESGPVWVRGRSHRARGCVTATSVFAALPWAVSYEVAASSVSANMAMLGPPVSGELGGVGRA